MYYKLNMAQIPGNFIFALIQLQRASTARFNPLLATVSGRTLEKTVFEASEKAPRLRESGGLARLREGLPVYLSLVFEPGSAIPMRRRDPRRRWPLGFVCDGAAAKAHKSMKAVISDNLMVFISPPFAVCCATLNNTV